MYKNLYADHIQNCLDQDKVWLDYTTNKLPGEFNSEKIINARIDLVKKHTGLCPYSADITEAGVRYPSALTELAQRPVVFEYTGTGFSDWHISTLNGMFDHSTQVIFTDSMKLVKSIRKKVGKATICCLVKEKKLNEPKAVEPPMDGLVSDELEPSLDGLFFDIWGAYSRPTIRVFLKLDDAIVIAKQIADVVVLSGEDEKLAQKIADIVENDFDPRKLLAIPGNAGCYTNKLIKKYWCLSDSVEDITTALGGVVEPKEEK
jgi:hypothetical protein